MSANDRWADRRPRETWSRRGLRMTRRLLSALLCLLVSASPSAGQAPSGPLVVAGSGTNLAITRLLADAFGRTRPGIKIEVPASIGSTGAIRAASEGAVAIGLVSRPLREQEKGLGLTLVPYARTAVVIGAHPAVADDSITFEDLVDIYRGTKTRWRDGHEIIVLTREPQDSSIEVLERVVPGFKAAYAESQQARRWRILFSDQEMNAALAKTPYAIGLSDMGTIAAERLPVKPLKVNGVPPDPGEVRSGRYPLVKKLAFVFLADRIPTAARAFVDFARSREGEKVLMGNGYEPHQ